MTQQQVSRGSGSIYHVNLDSVTARDLTGCQQLLRDQGFPLSQSAIVRRALRYYLQQLKQLTTEQAVSSEIVEVMRAAQGFA